MGYSFQFIESLLERTKKEGFDYAFDDILLTRLLQFTQDMMLQKLNCMFEEYKINNNLFLILLSIRSSKQDGIQASTLSDRLGISRVQVSRFVEDLVQRQWVMRRENSSDRRSQYLVITDEGNLFLDKVLPNLQQNLSRVWSVVNADEKQQLITTMKKLLKQIETIQSESEL